MVATSPDPTYRERLGLALYERGPTPTLWEQQSRECQEVYIADALAVEAIVRERWAEVAEERANQERERSKACIGLAGKSMYDAAAAAYQDIASSMREGS